MAMSKKDYDGIAFVLSMAKDDIDKGYLDSPYAVWIRIMGNLTDLFADNSFTFQIAKFQAACNKSSKARQDAG